MKVFIWSRIEKCSDNYHEEGGVVVFAMTEERARKIANKNGCRIADSEKPDDVRGASGNEKVYLFLDAGCC